MNLRRNEHLAFWNCDSDDLSHPIILFLHGSGERGSKPEDVLQWGLPKSVWAEQGRQPFQLIAPQCPAGLHWSDIIPECVQLILDSLAKRPLEVPIIGAGFSMGGQGVLEISASNPSLFQSILAVAPRNTEALQAIGYRGLVGTDVTIVHGEDDPIVHVSNSKTIADRIKQYSGKIELQILADKDHYIAEDVFETTNFQTYLSKQLRK